MSHNASRLNASESVGHEEKPELANSVTVEIQEIDAVTEELVL